MLKRRTREELKMNSSIFLSILADDGVVDEKDKTKAGQSILEIF